jgi:hypothetical protein
MTAKKQYHRARKTMSLKEMGLIVLVAAIVTLGLRQGMDDPNLWLVAGIFFLIALFLGCLFKFFLKK